MSKAKLVKFSEINTFPNVFQNFSYHDPKLVNHQQETVDLKGNWNNSFFKNDNPITLELACGRGEYTVALAKKFPDRNFIGVDIKGNRMYTGARLALEQEMTNAAFLRTDITMLALFLAQEEVAEIWITFPDPYLKKSKAQKRLTSSRFLNIYRKICKADAVVQLKTDDPTLYEFTLETLAEEKCNILWQGDDIYSGELPIPELEVKTYYEGLHLAAGKTIKYVRFLL